MKIPVKLQYWSRDAFWFLGLLHFLPIPYQTLKHTIFRIFFFDCFACLSFLLRAFWRQKGLFGKVIPVPLYLQGRGTSALDADSREGGGRVQLLGRFQWSLLPSKKQDLEKEAGTGIFWHVYEPRMGKLVSSNGKWGRLWNSARETNLWADPSNQWQTFCRLPKCPPSF